MVASNPHRLDGEAIAGIEQRFLEESGLTLTELHLIEESLVKGLIALYHSRIKYPEPKERRVA